MNMTLYKALYLTPEPEAAVATETLGPLAIATYELPNDAPIFSLDDIDALRSLGIDQPSRIVTRGRDVTHAWAQKIFDLGGYVGAKWWSYYSPDWTAVGLWNISKLQPVGDPAIKISKQIIAKAPKHS